MYVYIYIYIILWEEDGAKQLYVVLKVSCRRTDNLQPSTAFQVVPSWLPGTISQVVPG